jgi:hypothetical protein
MQYWDQIKPYAVPFGLFVILAPGLILSLPATSKVDCASIAPLPDTAAGTCVDGEYDGVGSADFLASDMLPICAAQKKCNSLINSRTVTVGTTFVHAVVFLVLLYLIENMDYFSNLFSSD